MAHVTFIHGISNQPPQPQLLRAWCRALSDAVEPLSLSDANVTTSLVYWADFMYAAPAAVPIPSGAVREMAAAEAVEDTEWPTPDSPEAERFVAALRARLAANSDAETLGTAPAGNQPMLERVPLPWFVKRPVMKIFLRDVHHYLFDTNYAPQGRTPVRIQQSIRKRFVEALCAPAVSRPHVVVAHSMGTVIAYDCLKRVAGCSTIDGLITIGSPLGLDEVQDQLRPGWTRNDGFPGTTLAGKWFNLFDHLDPVCGLDPHLANDYRRSGADTVEDIVVQNDGVWRHSATKYLGQPRFTAALRQLLQL